VLKAQILLRNAQIHDKKISTSVTIYRGIKVIAKRANDFEKVLDSMKGL
jgi:hypothetical protein